MKRSILRIMSVIFVLAIFGLTSAFAATAEKKWFVIKDKAGVCKVIQAKEKTPKAIAGPFDKKEAAEKAKAEQCPKKEKKEKPADKK